jgi:hypothetical protein
MALTLSCELNRSLTMRDFNERVAEVLDREETEDALQECAPLLKALSNNGTVVTEKLNEELANWKDFQGTNQHTAQTMLLGGGRNFRVRANIWTPLSSDISVGEAERRLFFYNVPHDHNFSFLTVGYFGPGYQTVIYEYDSRTVSGLPGEQVAMHFKERTSLSRGKVMLYRAGRDIHSQEHASAFSVSLNLLMDTPEVKTRNQFFFDFESETIAGFVPHPVASRMMICQLATRVGDGRTAELLDTIAEVHPFPRLRAAACEALIHLIPLEAEKFRERAANDVHPIVRKAAQHASE